MSALWTSREMEEATLGRAMHEFEAQGVSIDTRTLKPGDLFIALKGDARDGHAFVTAALAGGAAGAMVSRIPHGADAAAPLLMVANTQRGLEDLGREGRARSNGRIVAVTGSAGKTTAKEMLRLALGALGPAHASASSYNNHWGVPLSLAQLPRDHAYGVFEIGMNHFGEVRTLTGFVRPEAALVTTIAAAHLEYFGSIDAIADAKAEIFEGLLAGGAAIIPADNPCSTRLAARATLSGVERILTFGESPGSDAHLLSLSETADAWRVDADILGRRHSFRMGAPGAHVAHDALATLLAVAAVEGDVAPAAEALAAFTALKGRGARLAIPRVGGSAEIIDESYNANPASMRAALALLGSSRPGAGGRRIAVLGDMLELGAESTSLHASLATPVEVARADLVFACGRDMRALFDALPAGRRGAWGETSSAIASPVVREARAGDVILVKGSLGSRMAVILDALTSGGGAQ
ncbi:MAG TPA: UDP-N-acetylmuramoyl-tripeptide--D-alanyl-D-alanine ligase [Rhizomicrobium sp.]|jgi:UDP-N-acetylmuramoyl-tripeptide--D-alanyl-D-alanine ligase|nr:UDP-N-acetylmuramoyl-tripeptide--D-alanyl-D-alanine ligase [Rhizomicrobium sp.]